MGGRELSQFLPLRLIPLSYFGSVFGPVNITSINVTGVAAALDKHANGTGKVIKAVVELDKSGVLQVNKVYATYEVPPPPKVRVLLVALRQRVAESLSPDRD